MRYFKPEIQTIEKTRAIPYDGPRMSSLWHEREEWTSYNGNAEDYLLYFENGILKEYTQQEWEELNKVPRIFSRRSIIKNFAAQWEQIEGSMSFIERALFYGSDYLKEDDEDFQGFITKMKNQFDGIDLEEILNNSIYEG